MIGFQHLCQLPSDEEDRRRYAKHSLTQEQEQVLLGAGSIFALAHLEGKETSPQHQKLCNLQDAIAQCHFISTPRLSSLPNLLTSR